MSRDSARHLIHWLRSLGGHVDERIAVASTAKGRRGLVATTAIPETTKPLVAIPEPLVLTPSAALYSLEASSLLSASQADALADYALASKDLIAPIALLLAADAERIKRTKERRDSPSLSGRDWPMSPWGAYAASLSPPQAEDEGEEEGGGDGGCAGWFLGKRERETAISSSPSLASSQKKKRALKLLDEAVQYERAAVERTQALLIGRGSDLVSSGIASAEMMLWARSQIVSRAFAAPPGPSSTPADVVPALLPVIDLCNHSPVGGFPAWGTVRASEGGGSGGGSDGARLCWLRNKQPLAAGEELTTDYSKLCGRDPAAWMVNYGFVPEEVE